MNLLAHAYLSFNEPGILTGNMISDHVKGKKRFDFNTGIQNGIVLHRAIDAFTDQHPAVKEVMGFFRKDYRLYASPITDIILDYFVANDEQLFAGSKELTAFSQQVYISLENDLEVMPDSFRRIFSYMKKEDWLFNYSTDEGIKRSLNGLVMRSRYLLETDRAFATFTENKEVIRSSYNTFFPMLKSFAKQTLVNILHR